MTDKVKLSVLGLSYNHSNTGAYALVLAEESGMRRIPIIIGAVEAQAIAIQLEGLTPPRPLTHDLFYSFADSFRIRVEEVFIYKLRDGIFYSELVCYDGRNRVRIDSRTSDAVALALRFKVSIYTTSEILDRSGIIIEEEHEMSSKPQVQESKTHSKSQPKATAHYSEMSIEELNSALNKAIAHEDYEKASEIRDALKKRTE